MYKTYDSTQYDTYLEFMKVSKFYDRWLKCLSMLCKSENNL